MKNRQIFGALTLAVVALLVAPAAVAAVQESGGGGLRRIEPVPLTGDSRTQEDAREDPFEEAAWRARLSDLDLEAREKAFDELVGLAARSPAAKRALELWTRESDTELAWTSRLALRELAARPDAGPEAFRFRHLPDPFGRGGMEVEWRDLRQRMQEIDHLFGSVGTELDQLLREMGVDPRSFGMPGAPSTKGLGLERSESFQLEIGPQGVTCRVTAEVDGELVEREYTAESLEALLAAHPELKDRISTGTPDLGDPSGVLRKMLGTGLFEGLGDPLVPRTLRGAAVPTDMLGIEFRPAAAAVRERHGLEPDQGLAVERTLPGTIASQLEIRRGDVLLSLNGRKLRTGEDVSAALAARAADEPVVVELIDSRGRERTVTWSPDPGMDLPGEGR